MISSDLFLPKEKKILILGDFFHFSHRSSFSAANIIIDVKNFEGPRLFPGKTLTRKPGPDPIKKISG